MKYFFIASAALVLLASPAFAAKPVEKPELVDKVCAGCHGATGVSAAPTNPNLGGQYANYLEHALKAYRSGDRKNAIMNAQAEKLTDSEIKALSAWYSQQAAPLAILPIPNGK